MSGALSFHFEVCSAVSVFSFASCLDFLMSVTLLSPALSLIVLTRVPLP